MHSCYIRASQTSTSLGLDALSDKIEYWGFRFHRELMASQPKAAKKNNDKASKVLKSSQATSC